MDIVLLHYHLTRGLNSKYGAHIIQRKRERERETVLLLKGKKWSAYYFERHASSFYLRAYLVSSCAFWSAHKIQISGRSGLSTWKYQF